MTSAMANPPTISVPRFAGFDDLEAASHWRAKHGGWIFVGAAGGCTWFDYQHTPSVIFMHPLTRGQGGKLV